MRVILVFMLIVCTFNIAQAEEFAGKVIRVLDGDTILVLHNGHPVKVRFAGVDAPEAAQEYGMTAKQFVSGLVLRKQVQVSTRAVDDYGRLIAQVSVGELNVETELVKRGLAWAAEGRRPRQRESTDAPVAGERSRLRSNQALVALQNEAKSAQRGLWAQPNPIPPQEWRKTHAAPSPQHAVQAVGCNNKYRCSQMKSCDEAYFYLEYCGVKSLDYDRDGMPCESLCSVKGTSKKPDFIPTTALRKKSLAYISSICGAAKFFPRLAFGRTLNF